MTPAACVMLAGRQATSTSCGSCHTARAAHLHANPTMIGFL